MKNLLSGFAFSLLPIYSFVSWIYVFGKNENQEKRIDEFKKLLFNIELDFKILSLINILFILVALMFFIKNFKQNKSLIFKGFSIFFITFLMFMLIYNIWGML